MMNPLKKLLRKFSILSSKLDSNAYKMNRIDSKKVTVLIRFVRKLTRRFDTIFKLPENEYYTQLIDKIPIISPES